MLQISTGRFFGGAERSKADGMATLASVVELRGPVLMAAGLVEPHGMGPRPDIHLARFTFQYGLPKPPPDKMIGSISAVGEREIVQQLRVLLQVVTGRVWADSAKQLEELLEREDSSRSEGYKPYPMPGFLARKAVDGAQLSRFLNDTLSLRRRTYEQVVAAATALDTAARAAEDSPELAFTLSVFTIESFVPDKAALKSWAQVDKEPREQIDKVLEGVEEKKANAIRKVVLGKPFWGVTAGFKSFVHETVRKSFFQGATVRRSDFARLVTNAYKQRSKFVHRLKGDKRVLKGPHFWSRTMDGDVHLTLWGAFQVAADVIQSIVESSEHLQAEKDVPWNVDLPGTSWALWATSEWLWKPGTFDRHLNHRFRDLFEYLEEARACEGRPGASIQTLMPTLSARAQAFDVLSDDDKRLLMVILLWWDRAVPPEHRVPETLGLVHANEHLLRDLTVETLALHAALNVPLPWEASAVEEAWNKYEEERRYTMACPPLPHPVESVIRAAVANHHLAAGKHEDFVRWCHRLADDEGWRPAVKDHALTSAANRSPVDIEMVLRYRTSPAP